MNTRPTYTSLQPVETGDFNKQQRRHDKRRVEMGATMPLNPGAFDANAFVQPTAVAAIRKAFVLAKTSHEAWRSYKREGRFDVRQAPRAARMEQDVFKRRTGASTTHVKVGVLIDSSGSMAAADTSVQHPDDPTVSIKAPRRVAAGVFGATIAKALGTVPTVNLDVYNHGASGAGAMTIKHRWAKGTPVAVFNESVTRSMGGGGNADGHALYAVTERMRKDIKRGERGVILVVSDGLPSVYANDGRLDTGQALVDAVAHARKQGFDVIAVAIDGSDQSAYYGEQHTIPFTGNWTALGSTLARHIGAALAAKR